jgi:hypothetical protein
LPLAQEYTAFRIDALGDGEQDSFRFKMIGKSKSVLQWWIADGTDWPLLQNLAIRVFSLGLIEKNIAMNVIYYVGHYL